jgi:hypothetical protein
MEQTLKEKKRQTQLGGKIKSMTHKK